MKGIIEDARFMLIATLVATFVSIPIFLMAAAIHFIVAPIEDWHIVWQLCFIIPTVLWYTVWWVLGLLYAVSDARDKLKKAVMKEHPYIFCAMCGDRFDSDDLMSLQIHQASTGHKGAGSHPKAEKTDG